MAKKKQTRREKIKDPPNPQVCNSLPYPSWMWTSLHSIFLSLYGAMRILFSFTYYFFGLWRVNWGQLTFEVPGRCTESCFAEHGIALDWSGERAQFSYIASYSIIVTIGQINSPKATHFTPIHGTSLLSKGNH